MRRQYHIIIVKLLATTIHFIPFSFSTPFVFANDNRLVSIIVKKNLKRTTLQLVQEEKEEKNMNNEANEYPRNNYWLG